MGAFLICKIPAKEHKRIRKNSALPPFNHKKNKICYLVIDGQQRLSVLYAAISGGRIKTKRYSEGYLDAKHICLSGKEEKLSEFGFYDDTTKKGRYPLFEILNENIITETKRTEECRRKFEDYSFPFIFLDGFDQKKMKEAFIRLNTGGTRLSAIDEFLAESYNEDIDIRAHLDQLVDSGGLKNGFQDIDEEHFIKAIAANLGVKDFFKSGLRQLAKRIVKPSDEYHRLYKNKQKKMFESIKMAADFLTNNFKIPDASLLPYPAILSMLSVFYYNHQNCEPTPEQIKEIRIWFWITGLTQRYSGDKQRYNLMNDAIEMKILAKKPKHKLDLGKKKALSKISIDTLCARNYKSSRDTLRNVFLCYLISKKPKNFSNGEPVLGAEVSSILTKKNYHHIFPRTVLKAERYPTDKIDILANICIIRFGENGRFEDAPPWEYLKKYRNNKCFSAVLNSHAIPDLPCVLNKGEIEEKFDKFKLERIRIIKKDLISYVGRYRNVIID